MSHEDALSKSLGTEGINEGGLDKLLTHKAGLKDRPDWDGKSFYIKKYGTATVPVVK